MMDILCSVLLLKSSTSLGHRLAAVFIEHATVIGNLVGNIYYKFQRSTINSENDTLTDHGNIWLTLEKKIQRVLQNSKTTFGDCSCGKCSQIEYTGKSISKGFSGIPESLH
ncbi:hypothetical protein ABKN59_006857 [Abortiporus biennis]